MLKRQKFFKFLFFLNSKTQKSQKFLVLIFFNKFKSVLQFKYCIYKKKNASIQIASTLDKKITDFSLFFFLLNSVWEKKTGIFMIAIVQCCNMSEFFSFFFSYLACLWLIKYFKKIGFDNCNPASDPPPVSTVVGRWSSKELTVQWEKK